MGNIKRGIEKIKEIRRNLRIKSQNFARFRVISPTLHPIVKISSSFRKCLPASGGTIHSDPTKLHFPFERIENKTVNLNEKISKQQKWPFVLVKQ